MRAAPGHTRLASRRSIVRDALGRAMSLTLALALAVLGIDSAMLRVAMPAHFHRVELPVNAAHPEQVVVRHARHDHDHGHSHEHGHGHGLPHDHDLDRAAQRQARHATEAHRHSEVARHQHDIDATDVVFVADDATLPGVAKRTPVTTDGIVPSWVLQLSRMDAARFTRALPSTYRSLSSEPPDPPPRTA